MSAWELTNITARLLLPPGVLIIVGLIGLSLVRSRVRIGAGLALFAFVALYLLSMPIVSRLLIQSLQTPYADPAKEQGPGAIVVLTGGVYPQAPEYGGDTASGASLERARYAAHLHRRTGKPILVTGGNPIGAQTSEAEQMKTALREFGVTTKWVETASNNTFESARLTREMLKKAGVQSVYLVTHAWHMPRAKMAFERAGLHVIPAPMSIKGDTSVPLLAFFPSLQALGESSHFFHEVVGMAWYRLKFDLARR